MKLLTIFFFINTWMVLGQYTVIPDTNFEQELITQGIDTEALLDGQVLTSDIDELEELAIAYTDAVNLVGIEDFTMLKRLYIFYEYYLDDLDLSANTELTDLRIVGMEVLDSLNIDNCTNLEILELGWTHIENVDFTNKTALQKLLIYNYEVGFPTWDYIDLSPCPNLDILYFENFMSPGINLTNNNLLETLVINFVYLEEALNVSNCPLLSYLDCKACGLGELDLTNNINLKELYCGYMEYSMGGGTNNFTELDLSNNINLEIFECNYVFDDLAGDYHLDFSNNPNLISIDISENMLDSVNIANGNNENLEFFDIEHNYTLACVQVDSDAIALIANNDENSWTEDEDLVYSYDCTGIGIDDVPQTTIALYPNPTTGILSIENRENKKLSITVFNDLGQKVLILEQHTNSIDLSKLGKGVYTITIQDLEKDSLKVSKVVLE